MKIINKTDLPYKVIGDIIDRIIENSYEDTCYFGKIEYFEIKYKDKIYKVQIRYLKRYVEWRFYEKN